MKRIRIIGISLFMLILIVPSLIWGGFRVLDSCGLNIIESIDDDLGEKREKAQLTDDMTEVSTGEMLEKYYNDRIPFRSRIITIDKKLTSTVERPYNNYIEKKYSAPAIEEETAPVADDGEVLVASNSSGESFWDNNSYSGEDNDYADGTGTATEGEALVEEVNVTDEQAPLLEEDVSEELETSEATDEEELPLEEEFADEFRTSLVPLRVVNEKVILGADNWLYYGEKKCINNFRGANLKSEDELAAYAAVFSNLQNKCNVSGKQLRIFVCPDKESIYPEHYPNVDRVSEISLTEQIKAYIDANTEVSFLYPKDELRSHKGMYQLYYMHDSHWNAAGGYVGTRTLLTSLGNYVPGIDDIYTAPVTINSGDLILLGGLSQSDYPEDTNYDVGYMTHVGVFSDGSFIEDRRRIDITSQSENHSYLVMVGDSCKMNMLQYLAPNYDHMTFIHKNAISDTSSIKALTEADVIVLETAERNINELAAIADKISAIIPDSVIVEE